MNPAIPVVLCFDANYAPYAAVATSTLIQASRSALEVYWLVPSADVAATQALRDRLMAPHVPIEVVGVEEARFSEWKETHHISRGAYLRLLIPELLAPSRVIYLDCDTVVLSDLTELYETPLGDCALAGVADPVGGDSSRVPRLAGDVYINSGVLLMDLDRLRQDGFGARAEAIYREHRDTITWLDQCIINKYAEGRKCLLASRWNRQLFTQRTHWTDWRALLDDRDTAVVHFVGGIKPWQAWCHPEIAAFWWGHANRLAIPGLTPQPLTSAEQVHALADVLQLNGHEAQANGLRRGLQVLQSAGTPQAACAL